MPAKSKYPRYVRELKGSLYYQRDYPTKLRQHYDKKTFTKPLGLKASNYTEPALQRAMASAAESYDLRVKMIQNTDLGAYSEVELDKAAADLISSLGYKAGEFHGNKDFTYFAAEIIPGIEEVEEALKEADYYQKPANLTPEQEVKRRAYRALEEQWSRKPLMLSDLWQEYISDNGIDISTRDGKRTQRYWDGIVAYIGDHRIDHPMTLDAIHAGLAEYYDERRKKGVKVQSIKREYAQVVAAFNAGSYNHRLNWALNPKGKNVKADPIRQKKVLEIKEQIALLKYCLQDKDSPEVSAALIFQIQSGAMASEIRRLDAKEVLVDLNAPIPQISIGKASTTKVKAEERRRVVPIVFGRDYLAENLPKSIEWINRVTESNVAHRLKKAMHVATGNMKLSAHCLRHTIRANGDIADANPSHVACICGWAQGANKIISTHMQQYGAEALSKSEGFQAVTATSRKIHQHLIDAIEKSGSNVVHFNNAG